MTLGGRIREIRRRQHLTLAQLSARCRISVSHLSEIERGRTTPSPQTIVRVADALEQSPSTLTEGVDGWDSDKQEMVESLMASGARITQQSDPQAEERVSAPLPQALEEMGRDPLVSAEITEDWLEFLGSLSFRGRQPSSKRDWLGLYLAIKPYFDERSG